MRLQTTDSELHALAQADDVAREGTEFVRVPRVALRNLLRDHYTLNSAVLQRHGTLPETAA